MTTLAEIREFEDSIYHLVDTDNWAEIEEKMDDEFLKLLVDFVYWEVAVEKAWSARIHIHKKSHPIKKEREIASEAAAKVHLHAIEQHQLAGEAVRLAFLGECGVQEAERKQQELFEAWGRAARAGLI